MTYEIKSNDKFNSKEVYFDGKPSEAVRTSLKKMRFRWHSIKKCWYGYANDHEIVSAILSTSTNEEPATVVTDGYLGGRAVYGSKSNLHLYGTDLAKAIRADLKSAGIKGVTISSKHGNIQATLAVMESDRMSESEFIDKYSVKGAFGWVDYTNDEGTTKHISICDYYALPDGLKEKIRIAHARREYARDYATSSNINHYHLDKYNGFTAEFRKKMAHVLNIISAYRFDESNSMVDYFHTNFYIDIYTKVIS